MFLQVAHDLLPLIEAHQAVVHKDAVQPVADGLVQQHSSHRGINAAGQGADHMAVADLLLELFEAVSTKEDMVQVDFSPQTLNRKLRSITSPWSRMGHFRVELQRINFSGVVAHGSDFQAFGLADDVEPWRRSQHMVAM